MKRNNKIVISLFFFFILSFNTSLLAKEQAVGYDYYFLGANGHNLNYKYYINSEVYFKAATGYERLDSLDGYIGYNYSMIAFGYGWGEIYYKMPQNEKLSSKFITKEVEPYFGIDLVMERRGIGWNYGMTIGFFNPPQLKYQSYNNEENTNITGMTVGFKLSYTFGNNYSDDYYKKRNRKTLDILRVLGAGGTPY